MDIAEKRVYEERGGRTRLAVATGAGLAVVGISGDVIGEFGLAVREPAVDLAGAGDGRFLAATGDDVLLVELDDSEDVAGTERVVETDAGGANAVAVVDGDVVAAGSDGVVRRASLADLETAAEDGAAADAWTELGEADARAADGRLLAATDGVYRVGDAGVDHVGLDDAHDVAAAGPLAATGDGCYRLGPGWTAEFESAVDVVAAAADDAGIATAHAASDRTLYERAGGADSEAGASGDDSAAGSDSAADGDAWRECEWPASAAVADVAYEADAAAESDDAATTADAATYAVAIDGTVLADDGDGWRTRSLGLPDVRACAVVR